MTRNGAARFGLVVAALGAAACSQAQISLILASNGMGALLGSNTAVFAETVDFQSSGTPPLTNLIYSLNTTTLKGFGAYEGTTGDLDFTFMYDASTFRSLAPGEGSIDGTWNFSGGTGSYAHYTGGSGSLALTFLQTSSNMGLTATTFSGDLTPEPGSYLALGIGVAGLLIRRRRRNS